VQPRLLKEKNIKKNQEIHQKSIRLPSSGDQEIFLIHSFNKIAFSRKKKP
jgi:hypothetical protein